MVFTSLFLVRATKPQPRYATCARSALTPSACPPFPRPSSPVTWAWRFSESRASPTWPLVSCQRHLITVRSWRQRAAFEASSERCWRASLAASDRSRLIEAARRARDNAHAQFSHFKVGAALETSSGTVITGCNVENATYGLTICAERVAMFKALSDGHRAFSRIAIVADTEAPTPPCGACRQILSEFGGGLEILLANLTDEKGAYRLRDLLPLPFDAKLL